VLCYFLIIFLKFQLVCLKFQESVGSIHPVMHSIVEKNPELYLDYDPLLRKYLEALQNEDKKLFLVTNSPFHFV